MVFGIYFTFDIDDSLKGDRDHQYKHRTYIKNLRLSLKYPYPGISKRRREGIKKKKDEGSRSIESLTKKYFMSKKTLI